MTTTKTGNNRQIEQCPVCKGIAYSDGGMYYPDGGLLFYCSKGCGWHRAWKLSPPHMVVQTKEGKGPLSSFNIQSYTSLCSLPACHYIHIFLVPANLHTDGNKKHGHIIEFSGREIQQMVWMPTMKEAIALVEEWKGILCEFRQGWKGYQEPEILPDSTGERIIFRTRRTSK